MRIKFNLLLQYVAPQHALSRFAGWVANNRWPWLKNKLIHWFIKRYKVDMSAALIEFPEAYDCFNHFFTRHLKPELRPIAAGENQVISPIDGNISQIGKINQSTLLQVKGFDFNLIDLLGGSTEKSQLFENGNFVTFYLSPRDYHRVHMPLAGKLRETIYIPGNLFSVNDETANYVPKLYARNERLVCLFDTSLGPMAVILVGAMIVGSIKTVWPQKISRVTIETQSYNGSIELDKGAEMGHFELGSTVITLFGKDKITWAAELGKNSSIIMGQLLGTKA